MRDEGLVQLCRTIYRKHRDAIDLILEFGVSSRIMDAVQQGLERHVECEFFISRGRNSLWFLPKVIGAQLPTVEMDGWHWLERSVAIACWFEYLPNHGKLKVLLEVGPMADAHRRIELMKSLKATGFSFWEGTAFSGKGKYSRIVTKSQKLRAAEDGEVDDGEAYVADVAESLWKKLWEEGEKVVSVLKSFNWQH